nr:reverse transcriptase domain-containing protein [Tanacetum cinerariifolium]
MATNGKGDNQPPPDGGDLPVLDLRTMKELCKPTLNGQVPNYEPVVAPVEAPVSAPKPNPKPSIPYPSRLNDQKLREKANDQMEKFFQIFHDLNFNISFADALILMPKFAFTIKSLLTNKESLFELARTPLNEHCSTVLLKKLPEKLGDPGKFLIPCDFSGMDECLALADLGTSINLMPLSAWKMFSLPELSPTCMTLEFVDQSISRPVSVVEDFSVKTGWALIDVYKGELTLRVGNKAVTFNLDQTSRYSFNYDDNSVNRIDVINIACEEYSQGVLGFSDERISLEINDSYYDSEGDILLLEEFLNDDPSSAPLPPQELKVVEPKNEKYSIDEPPVFELKDLPPHLKYAFLKGDDKLPVKIAKDLKDDEKTALINPWVSPVHCFPKKDGFTVVENEENELIPTLLVTGWRTPKIKKRPHSRILMERLPTIACLSAYVMHREKSHFMVKEGIVLGHKISKNRIEVDKAKVDVIAKLSHPTTVKGIQSFLGHADFYRRFIQDFSKIARPMTRLLEKDTPFIFSKGCIEAFQSLKKKLTEAPILVTPIGTYLLSLCVMQVILP